MSSTRSSINLFRGRKQNFFDKFMKWALTFGRFIVILTETIALLAFLYRFSLDRELIDLHEEIKNKQTVIKLLKDKEDKYRNLQERLAMIASLTKSGNETLTIVNDLNLLIPADVIINDMLLSENQLKIEARIQSVATLVSFINKLKAYPKISSVSLDRIENKATSSVIAVSITALIKNKR